MTTSLEEIVKVRGLEPGDLDAALGLWVATEGLGLNESDSREALLRFLARNPGQSAVAEAREGEGAARVVGAVLCGHDGRRGALHHLAVDPSHRGRGLGSELIEHALAALRREGIPRCNIYLYDDNEDGARFCGALGGVR